MRHIQNAVFGRFENSPNRDASDILVFYFNSWSMGDLSAAHAFLEIE